MLSDARDAFWAAIGAYPWVASLANILPLSALLDFLDTPRVLHALQLTGTAPFWSWPVTPAGSRLILAPHKSEDACCLDQFGNSPGLVCLDGRYGDKYFAANPETLRLCLASVPPTMVINKHENMARGGFRLQKLTVARVERRQEPAARPLTLVAASAGGWAVLLVLLVLAGLMHCWLALAFLLVVPATGVGVFLSHGGRPRELRKEPEPKPGPEDVRVGDGGQKKYSRLVVAALHMNETDWLVFYGESALVNSMLNYRLLPRHHLPPGNALVHAALRLLILSQWALAVGAAALQAWDAYLITFWLGFCIIAHTRVFSHENLAKDWAVHAARLQLSCFQTHLSGRRALLTAIVAMNPDTFAQDNNTKFSQSGLQWVDPILKRTADRDEWEAATCRALAAVGGGAVAGDSPGEDWDADYKQYKWRSSVLEGIKVAAQITHDAGLSGRSVTAGGAVV
ncbi:hypothetical protein RB601_006041 [Gaeumannomyces tritici]